MKKVILAFSTMLALATSSFAQNAPAATAPAKAKAQGKEIKEKGKEHSKEMGEKGKAPMGGNLGLSAEQETKFKALNEAQKSAMQKLDMEKTLSADAKKTQKDALKSKYEADVKSVMNADQFAKWTAMRAKRDEKKSEMSEKKGNMEDHKMEDHKSKGKAKSDKSSKPQGESKSN
jgi:periplasmic protein CpxP/Spy